MLLNTIVVALSLPFFSQAASILRPYRRGAEGRYIVTLEDGVSRANVLGGLTLSGKLSSQEVQQWDKALNGFAAHLSEADIDKLGKSSDVVDIEDEGTMHTLSSVTQTNAPWGLGRITSKSHLSSSNSSTLTFNFTHDPFGGAGVDIYVLDTGIRLTHVELGSRARSGTVFGGYPATDGHGHGTHISGTAAGATVGVARGSNLVSVKVLSDSGSGTTSNVVSGINWIYNEATALQRPAVVLIALGGSGSTAVDSAVTALTNAGIHVVVAAGGSNAGTENSSPGRVPSVILVAASSILDARAPFANYGPSIDVFAPGVDIYSSWYTSDTGYATLSGNSMAAAHVAGVVAYLIGLEGNVSPAAMHTKIFAKANQGQLTSVPAGTSNSLVYIGA